MHSAVMHFCGHEFRTVAKGGTLPNFHIFRMILRTRVLGQLHIVPIPVGKAFLGLLHDGCGRVFIFHVSHRQDVLLQAFLEIGDAKAEVVMPGRE